MNGIDIARTVAARLVDPASIETSPSGTPWTYNKLYRWSPIHLAGGNSGVAMLFAVLWQLDRSPRWRDAMHAHLSAAASAITAEYQLYMGTSGLLAAAKCAATEADYKTFVSDLIQHVHFAIKETQETGTVGELELINGLAGVLLAVGNSSVELATTIETRILLGVSEVFSSIEAEAASRTGETNLSMSHGVSGILAALAINGSMRSENSIGRLAEFVCKSSIATVHGPSFAGFARGGEAIPTRIAWCYGTPGTAVAVLLAGIRLKSQGLIEMARDSLKTVMRTPREDWMLTDHAICHGTAGVALCFLRAFELTREEAFRRFGLSLLNEVADAFNPETTLGYLTAAPELGMVDEPGFLTGCSGIALSLLVPYSKANQWLSVLGLY